MNGMKRLETNDDINDDDDKRNTFSLTNSLVLLWRSFYNITRITGVIYYYCLSMLRRQQPEQLFDLRSGVETESSNRNVRHNARPVQLPVPFLPRESSLCSGTPDIHDDEHAVGMNHCVRNLSSGAKRRAAELSRRCCWNNSLCVCVCVCRANS